MIIQRFGESISFGCVKPSAGHIFDSTTVYETIDKRLKEECIFRDVLIPKKFANTIICLHDSKTRKHYKSSVNYEIGSRPKHFSVTCYITPKRKELLVRSKSDYYDPNSHLIAVNKWFGSSLGVISKLKEHKIDGVLFVPDVHSTSESFNTKSMKSLNLLGKDLDINQNYLPSWNR